MPDRRILTDSEGAVLTLLLRRQPLTAYEVGKSFDASPVHTLNTSKGKLYPLIHRLHERGLLTAEEVPGDHRRTQRFYCTLIGKQALRRWVLTIRPEHELLHDPLRKKLQGFELLSAEEQLDWIKTTRQRLERKLSDVEQWPRDIEGPFGDLVQESAKVALTARLVWLEQLLKRVTLASS